VTHKAKTTTKINGFSLKIIVIAIALFGMIFIISLKNNSVPFVNFLEIQNVIPKALGQNMTLPNFSHYQNSKFGYSIDYPAEATKNENSTANFTLFELPEGSVSIQVFSATEGEQLGDYAKTVTDYYKHGGYSHLHIVKPQQESLAGDPANYITFSYKDNGQPTTGLDEWTIANGAIYDLTFTSNSSSASSFLSNDNSLLPIANKMHDSFKIGEPPQQEQLATNTSNTTNTTSTPISFVPYQSSKFGFSIKYPNGATVTETNDGVDFTLSNGNKAEVRVSHGQNMDINQVTQQELKQLDKNFPNAQLISSEDFALGGYPGHQVIFNSGIGGIPVLLHWTIANGKEYKLEFIMGSGSADFTSTDPIRNSFRIGLTSTSGGQGPFTSIANNTTIAPPLTSLTNNTTTTGSFGSANTNNRTGQIQSLAFNQTGNFSQYKDSNFGFNVDYPKGWTVKQLPQGVAFIQAQAPYASIKVNVRENETFQNMGLNHYTDMRIRELKNQYKEFHLEDTNDTTIANNPGHYLVFTYANASNSVGANYQYTIVGDRAYEIQALTPVLNIQNIAPIFNTVLQSLQIKEPNTFNPQGNSSSAFLAACPGGPGTCH
jgi:hypothetical protein